MAARPRASRAHSKRPSAASLSARSDTSSRGNGGRRQAAGERSGIWLELVNDADRNLWVVLVSAEEPRAYHVTLQPKPESLAAWVEINSTAGFVGKGALAAERCLGQKLRASDQAVRPYLDLLRNCDPVAHPCESHLDSRIDRVIWCERGRKLTVTCEMTPVRIVGERHVKTVQIASNARELIKYEVRKSNVGLPVVVLKNSIHALGFRFGLSTQSQGVRSGNRLRRRCRSRKSKCGHGRSYQQRRPRIHLGSGRERKNQENPAQKRNVSHHRSPSDTASLISLISLDRGAGGLSTDLMGADARELPSPGTAGGQPG